MCNRRCTHYYDPVEEEFFEIDCVYCKKNINESIKRGQITDIQFICDKEHEVENFMRVCYRYRNWYGEKEEYIFISEEEPHYDFMKLCVDSSEIKYPVVYKATGIYDGLSENGNPLWIIIGNIEKIYSLHPYYNEHPCDIRGLPLCQGCGVCEEIERDKNYD